MKEYIEREALLEHIKEELSFCEGNDPEKTPILYGCELGLCSANSFVEAMPAADVVERKRGEWVKGTWRSKCSVCGFYGSVFDADFHTFNFFPNCGADMRSRHDSLCDQEEEEA